MSSQSFIFNPTERTLAATGDGFSCPRLTTAGRTGLSLTANDKGMMVYDTTLTDLCIWNGAAWEFVNDNSNAIVSVKDYGAVGDGVTDDTAAINAAINTMSGGGTLYFPVGSYKITSAIQVKSGVTFLGASNVDPYYGTKTGNENPAYIFQASANIPVFSVGGGVCDVAWRTISIGSIQTPTSATSPSAGKYGISFEGTYPSSSYRFVFEKVNFYNFERAISVNGLPAATDWQCDAASVRNCAFFNNTIGVYFNTINADYWTFDTCGFLIPDNCDGVYMKRIGFATFISCTAGPKTTGAGADWIHVNDYYDQQWFVSCQVESIANFVHVDTSASFANNDYPLTFESCIFEAPSLLERTCRFVSRQCRFTESVNITGADVIVDSDGDLFTPPKKFNFLAARPVPIGVWQPWTPVPVPTSGAITSYTSLGQYIRNGPLVTVAFKISITNVGTAVALSSITGLPFDTNGYGTLCVGAGRETALTGKMWQFWTNAAISSSLNGKAYDNDPGISTGTVIEGTVTYFAKDYLP